MDSARESTMVVPVVYHSANGSLEVNAAIGMTLFRVDDVSGMTVRTRTTDFIVKRDALPWEPSRGDKIEYDGDFFEVNAPNGEQVWRWTGFYKNAYRIHANEIASEEEQEDGSQHEENEP